MSYIIKTKCTQYIRDIFSARIKGAHANSDRQFHPMPVDRFCAPVWELSDPKRRPVEHVSWILNTPDFEYVLEVITPVSWCHLDRSKYSRSRLFSVKISFSAEIVHDSPAVRFTCPPIGQNSFTPEAHPLPSYVTPFNINIRQFCQWSVWDSAPVETRWAL